MYNWFDMSQSFNNNNSEDGKENPFSFMQNMGPFAGGQNTNPWAFMQNFMQNMGPCMSGQNQGATGFFGPMQSFFGPVQNMNPWANFQSFMQNMGQCMSGQNQSAAGFFGPMQNMNPWANFQSFMQNMGQCMTGQNKNPWSSMQEFMQTMGQCMNGQNKETSDTDKQELSGEGVQFNNMYLMPFMFFYMQMMFQMYCMMLISQNAYRNWQQTMNMPAGAFPFKIPFPTCRNSETNDQQDGFSFGGFKLSPSDLQKLLQMNVSPKSLETLQKFLDTIFDAYSSSGK